MFDYQKVYDHKLCIKRYKYIYKYIYIYSTCGLMYVGILLEFSDGVTMNLINTYMLQNMCVGICHCLSSLYSKIELVMYIPTY